jgi:membrane-associated phospholipid phosphatase
VTVRATGRPTETRLQPRFARWWPDLALIGVFVAITASLSLAPVRDVDLAIRDLVDAHRPPAAHLIAETINRLGSGGLLTSVCLVLAAVIAVRRRTWWPFLPVGAAFLLTSAVIQPLKLLSDRAAPHAPLPDQVAVRLGGAPDGLSYPSGHAVNAVVWYAIVALLLGGWLNRAAGRWLRLAPPAVVTVVGTYLGFHWLTDMLAGLALAVPMSHLLIRLPWPADTHLGPPATGAG